MLSRRFPRAAEINAWTGLLEERRASGAALLDLTEANPTRVGLSALDDLGLEALAASEAGRYQPDPRGDPAARAAVVGYYAARGIQASAEDIVLTSGTSEAYAHLFRLLCDPGQEVVAPCPSYPLFEPLARLEGVGLETYRLEWDGRWRLDVESLRDAVGPETRAIIVVQPNHPTGSCLSPEEREVVEGLCQRHHLAIVSDEVFGDFPWPVPSVAAGDGRRSGPEPGAALPSLLSRARVPTFALSGLSKVCGMPQMKLSWITVAGPADAREEALEGLEWIADLFLSVSTPIQVALPRLLDARHAFRARVIERLSTNLGRLGETLTRQPDLAVLDGDGGWVVVLRMPGRLSGEEWSLELLRRDVVVHPGHFYDLGEAALVLSLIVEPAIFSEGLARLEALVGEG